MQFSDIRKVAIGENDKLYLLILELSIVWDIELEFGDGYAIFNNDKFFLKPFFQIVNFF